MTAVAGFPTIVGDHKLTVFPHTGPASYTQLTAAPIAGGDDVYVSEAGLHNFAAVWAASGLSDSGTYRVEGAAPAGNPSTNRTAGANATSWKLRWIVVATGAQAASELDLSAETVRLVAVGRY